MPLDQSIWMSFRIPEIFFCAAGTETGLFVNSLNFSPYITVAIGFTASGFPEDSRGMVTVNVAPFPPSLAA